MFLWTQWNQFAKCAVPPISQIIVFFSNLFLTTSCNNTPESLEKVELLVIKWNSIQCNSVSFFCNWNTVSVHNRNVIGDNNSKREVSFILFISSIFYRIFMVLCECFLSTLCFHFQYAPILSYILLLYSKKKKIVIQICSKLWNGIESKVLKYSFGVDDGCMGSIDSLRLVIPTSFS